MDRSVELLTEASLLAPDDVTIMTDLAAAHILRFDRLATPADLLHAIDAAERALSVDGGSFAARYNLALAKERLGLRPAEAWRRLAVQNADAAWAAETARRAVHAARRPALFNGDSLMHARVPSAALSAAAGADAAGARAFAMDVALPGWAGAVLDDDDALAGRWLAAARAIGAARTEAGGDRSIERLVLRAEGDGQAGRRRVARLYQAFGRARQAHNAGDFDAAAARYAALLRQLGAADEPLRGWVGLHLGTARLSRGDMGGAHQALDAASAGIGRGDFPVLAARLSWARGFAAGRDAAWAEAARFYAAAIADLEGTGEVEHAGALHLLLSQAEFELGEWHASLTWLQRSLAELGGRYGSVWLHNALAIVAGRARDIGLHHAAASLQEEGIAAAAATGSSVYEAEALIARARVWYAAGRHARAELDLEAARSLVDAVAVAASRDWLRADLLAVRASGGVEPALAPRPLIASLDTAATLFEAAGANVRLAPVLVARARAFVRAGRHDAAAVDLERAIAIADTQQRTASTAAHRAAYAHTARDAVDVLVTMHLRDGRVLDALVAHERARAAPISGVAPVRSRGELGGLLAALPQTAAVLVFRMAEDSVTTWALRNGSVRVARSRLSRVELEAALDRVRAAGARGAPAEQIETELRQLYGVLIEANAAALEGVDRLIVVPDGPLHAVPFSALIGPTGYLLERLTVHVTTGLSAELSEIGAAAAGARVRGARAALLVGTAAGSGAGLPPLPAVDRELAGITALYPGSAVIGPGLATSTELERRLVHAELFHFAGHAVSDPLRPDGSFLHLPWDDGGAAPVAARLTAARIRSLPLDNLRLAVLSACRTVTPTGTRGGGFDTLAHSFLAAGAHGVVGTLWDVEDRAASELIVRFHREYSRGVSAPAALRAAQRSLLASGRPDLVSPAAWAAFQYTGR